MSEHSPIGWTDATWPIVAGCDYVSPGCSNCWAVRDSWRLAHSIHKQIREAFEGVVRKTEEGKLVWTGVVRPLPFRLDWPLKWRGAKRIFVCSQADLWNRKVPFEFIAAAFGIAAMSPQHTLQFLTKNTDRMLEFFDWLASQQGTALETCLWHARKAVGPELATRFTPFLDKMPDWPLENVWLGTTVEDQKRADQRIPELLRAPAHVRWLSVEPMLEQMNLKPWLTPCGPGILSPDPHGRDLAIDWVVCGGESAQTRTATREFNLEWARQLSAQCEAAGVAFFMKQLGTNPVGTHRIDMQLPPLPIGKTSRYKWHEPEHWPQDLRVQCFPDQ